MSVAGLVAAALLAVVALFFLFLAIRRRRKRANRGEEILDKDQLDIEIATVTSSGDGVIFEPMSGLYKSDDTELELKFTYAALAGHNDPKKYYKISGQGLQKSCDNDSHVDFVSIQITDGYVAKDGSCAWWTEERRPFAGPAGKAMCPRPNGCFRADTGIPGIATQFSTDGSDCIRTKCEGEFDFGASTFEGQWAGGQQAGKYQLVFEEQLNLPQKPKGLFRKAARGVMNFFGFHKN